MSSPLLEFVMIVEVKLLEHYELLHGGCRANMELNPSQWNGLIYTKTQRMHRPNGWLVLDTLRILDLV